MNTTKRDLVMKIAQETNLIQQDVYAVIQRLLDHIMDSLVKGQNVELRNFGVFEVKKTKPKPKARNPKTNEIIYVAARRKTHFKPGKLLKESLKTPLDQIPPNER